MCQSTYQAINSESHRHTGEVSTCVSLGLGCTVGSGWPGLGSSTCPFFTDSSAVVVESRLHLGVERGLAWGLISLLLFCFIRVLFIRPGVLEKRNSFRGSDFWKMPHGLVNQRNDCDRKVKLSVESLLYSLLVFLLRFVFGDPTPGGQRDVDV